MSTIITSAEARVALGLTSTITDQQRALIEVLLPMVDAAIAAKLFYDPKYASKTEWYPLQSRGVMTGGSGVWMTNGIRVHLESPLRGEVMQLRRLPVRAISEVRVDFNGGFGQKAGTFGSDTVWESGVDYFQELSEPGHNASGHVYAVSGWPCEAGTVKITYAAGYTDAELAGQATQGPQSGDSAINASGIKKAALLTAVKAVKTLIASGRQGMAGVVSGPVTSESLGSYSYSAASDLVSALAGMKISVPPEAIHDLSPFINYGAALIG